MHLNSSKVWESSHCNLWLSENVDHAEHPYASKGAWLWWQSVIVFLPLFPKEIWSLSRQEVHWEWLGNIYHWLPWLFFEQIMSCVNDKYLYSRYSFQHWHFEHSWFFSLFRVQRIINPPQSLSVCRSKE